MVLHRFSRVDLHALPGQPAREIPLDEILLMIGAGLAGWQIAALSAAFIGLIIAGADLTHVVLHHFLRMVLVVLCAPVVMRLLARK